MAAYVGLIQRKEREIGCDVLTHQKWSGAEYVDGLLKTVTGGVSSTAAMGKVSSPSSTRPREQSLTLVLSAGEYGRPVRQGSASLGDFRTFWLQYSHIWSFQRPENGNFV